MQRTNALSQEVRMRAAVSLSSIALVALTHLLLAQQPGLKLSDVAGV
jgi:hypothetical protein